MGVTAVSRNLQIKGAFPIFRRQLADKGLVVRGAGNAEANLRFTCASGSVPAPLGTVPFDPNNSDQVGWAFETTLDVEWAHVMAPDANIVLLTSPVSETEGVQGMPEFLFLETYALDTISARLFPRVGVRPRIRCSPRQGSKCSNILRICTNAPCGKTSPSWPQRAILVVPIPSTFRQRNIFPSRL